MSAITKSEMISRRKALSLMGLAAAVRPRGGSYGTDSIRC